METIQLTDVDSNNYEYTSRGCIEHAGVFWEVLENTGDTAPYYVLWCHEEELPTSVEGLFSQCIFIDYRNEPTRLVETNNPDLKDIMLEIADICQAELSI
jgi:hypothetical protein